MVLTMAKDKAKAPKERNAALQTFRQNREKGSILFRFFALLLDFIIIWVLYTIAVALLGAPDVNEYVRMQDAVQGLAKDAPEVIERMRLWQQCWITFLGIGAAYEAVFLMLFRGTVGKLLFGFRVVSNNEDRNVVLCKLLLVLRAVVKALSLYLVSGIPFVFLCLTTFGNANARSGFDLFSGTRLLYKKTGFWFSRSRSGE